jgi:hypothetical protein
MHTYVEYCSTSTTQKFVGQTDYLICDSATNEPATQPFFLRTKAAIFNQKLVSYNGLGCPPHSCLSLYNTTNIIRHIRPHDYTFLQSQRPLSELVRSGVGFPPNMIKFALRKQPLLATLISLMMPSMLERDT